MQRAVLLTPSHQLSSSTVVKLSPFPLILSSVLQLTAERTIGERSSISLEGAYSVSVIPTLRALGQVWGGAIAFRYYPMAKTTAPNGWYVGPKVGYDRLRASSLLRLFTLFDATGDVSLWSLPGVLGYQLCTRGNIVLDTEASVSLLYHVTYFRSGIYSGGQPTVEQRTGFNPPIPGLRVSVGYRFRHHRAKHIR